LGSEEKPQDVLISAVLLIKFQYQVKDLLINYKDVFAWSYKELKEIPREIYEHKIELMVDAQPIKHKQYIMNSNYALKV
jgi:hypothetical protein